MAVKYKVELNAGLTHTDMKLIKRGFHLQDYNMNFIRTWSHSKITMA